MSATAKKLVVCGGSGFLGSRICKHAVARGWDVTSISRSGEPQWDTVTSSSSPPPWARTVSWERADVLRPSTYAPLLRNADYVVHSMGILLEADYKDVLRGRESPVAGLRRVFTRPTAPMPRQAAAAPAPAAAANPLDRRPGDEQGRSDEAEPADEASPPGDQFSYEVMNRDSAVMLARGAAREGVAAFCYVSAAAGAPVLPQRYITTKREAESAIASEFPGMRGVFARPPFLWDASRSFTLPLAAGAAVAAAVNGLAGGWLSGLMGAAGIRPLRVDTVAGAVVEALADEHVRGPVEVAELEELAARGWRREML